MKRSPEENPPCRVISRRFAVFSLMATVGAIVTFGFVLGRLVPLARGNDWLFFLLLLSPFCLGSGTILARFKRTWWRGENHAWIVAFNVATGLLALPLAILLEVY